MISLYILQSLTFYFRQCNTFVTAFLIAMVNLCVAMASLSGCYMVSLSGCYGESEWLLHGESEWLLW